VYIPGVYLPGVYLPGVYLPGVYLPRVSLHGVLNLNECYLCYLDTFQIATFALLIALIF